MLEELTPTGSSRGSKKQQKDGRPEAFPLTSLREINILSSLHHPDIAELQDVCSSIDGGILVEIVLGHPLFQGRRNWHRRRRRRARLRSTDASRLEFSSLPNAKGIELSAGAEINCRPCSRAATPPLVQSASPKIASSRASRLSTSRSDLLPKRS